ncbi:hypothetical protein LCI18_001823 [Fusarium solani-melongenae]|uniref:Uncharacterized protein n=1 Tax=Fusarium solani subsp. cucurbitae TaxID=2747967 RepID=A0ACD3YSQ4_FUSSC|nr:hypothetical protein LCI18_001823 [Fusarium solani-melongenae]
MQAWLFRFLRDGHSPFIHRLLYQAKTMPQCMQDAYTAIAISQQVTPENEHMVDKMLSSRMSSLLSSQPANRSLPFTIMSSKDHLAPKAENLIETLLRWTNQLWQSATQDTITSPLNEFCANLHELFVICESIGRTWILGNLATGVCHSLKAELWEPPSLARWETIGSGKDPLFIYSLDGQSLLARGVHASQVDEFARHIFTIMWGMDNVEN